MLLITLNGVVVRPFVLDCQREEREAKGCLLVLRGCFVGVTVSDVEIQMTVLVLLLWYAQAYSLQKREER